MNQIYIHGEFPGGNDRLKQALIILGYDRVIFRNDCKDSKEMVLEITQSKAFYTNRFVEEEFECRLADQLDLVVITNKKFESMMITKLIELTEEKTQEEENKS